MNSPFREIRAPRQHSQAGHYVVAAAIILAAVLLIVFLPRDNCCSCCCQRPAATHTTTTLTQLPIAIPPGTIAPVHGAARSLASAPAGAPASPAPIIGATQLPHADPIDTNPAPMAASAFTVATIDAITMLPAPAQAVVVIPDPPRVHVDEAGNSLAWMALGVVALFGARWLNRTPND